MVQVVTGDSQEEVIIFRYRQTELHHNIYININNNISINKNININKNIDINNKTEPLTCVKVEDCKGLKLGGHTTGGWKSFDVLSSEK